MSQRRILVTSALPYANGHIHIGHLVEYIQTDIWVRFQRLRGHRCVYICADDTHGTAIMIRARQEGRSEEQVIADMHAAHVRDFAGFHIEFDNYGSTHSEENRQLCAEIWQALCRAGLVVRREVSQLYDPVAGTFLADRFVRGTCPRCGAADQFGDSCDRCGSTYSPSELVGARSTLSGATPEVRAAPHFFIQTEQLHDFLAEWTRSAGHLHEDVAHWVAAAFLSQPLRDWDVSRPAPYFGFEIPDAPGHYWYVWFDAPIGYIASTLQWCRRSGEPFDLWWRHPETEIHHFIGKDITYFHTLFWPVMLKVAGFNLPRQVHIHGFLTVGGEKMSKSKGTFVLASTYLKHLDPAWLRYYYASKLTPKLDDLDLNLEEFVAKVNGDVVGKVVNLASRTARFVQGGTLSAAYPEDGGLFSQAAAEGDAIADAYEACDYNRAMRLIMALADRANRYVESREPWTLARDPSRGGELQDVCTVALNLFRQIALYLAPVLPTLQKQTAELLAAPLQRWEEARRPLLGTAVAPFKHMLGRADIKHVLAMIEESREQPAAASPVAQGYGSTRQAGSVASSADSFAPRDDSSAGLAESAAPHVDSAAPLAAEPLEAEISFEDFSRIDLRVARVIAAEDVPDSKKLLRLSLSLGGDVHRTVLAGIKGVYEPASLVGRLVIYAANLAPRQMRFGTSQGMVLAAGPGGKDIYLLSPDPGAQPGQRVH
jgi:methionyl-tRNA synthetase